MNAKCPLNILALGTAQHVHPDVVFVPGGFCGFEYWLAFTPYPCGNDRMENPCLRASHDGRKWVSVEGIREPLVRAPSDLNSHNSDPDLAYDNGTLYMVYATRDKVRRHSRFNLMSTRDGRRWTQHNHIYEGHLAVSPSMLAVNGIWSLWSVDFPPSENRADAAIFRRTGPNLEALDTRARCTLSLPGYTPWHIDVIRTSDGFEALLAAFPNGTDSSRTRLFHLYSATGTDFQVTLKPPVLAPSTFGWDNRMIYRSTFVKVGATQYQLWYSASSWSNRYGLGYLEGRLNRLRTPQGMASSAKQPRASALASDVWFRLKDIGRRTLHGRLLRAYREVRRGKRRRG